MGRRTMTTRLFRGGRNNALKITINEIVEKVKTPDECEALWASETSYANVHEISFESIGLQARNVLVYDT
jgi:hypothetical protein